MDLSNTEVRHEKSDGVEYLEFLAFDKYADNISAAFAIRGANNSSYYGEGSQENYEKLSAALSLNPNTIIQISKQVHGDNIVTITEPNVPSEADAMITNIKDISLVTRVADCIAVLVYDPVNNAIANIHSGWRGTLKRIAPKTILRMKEEFGTNPSDAICVLCPSIGVDHFEVDRDVKD